MKEPMLKVFQAGAKGLVHGEPVYLVRDGQFFRTAFHPDGWSELPDYDLGTDGRVYRTTNHPRGLSPNPDYAFGRDRKLYRTPDHPSGKSGVPEYEIGE